MRDAEEKQPDSKLTKAEQRGLSGHLEAPRGPGCLTCKEGLGTSMPGRVNWDRESSSHYLLGHQVARHGQSPRGRPICWKPKRGSRSIRFTVRKMAGFAVE